FEQGRFDRAADCWLAVLRERTDTDLSPGLLAVKAALALSRAGRRSEFEQVRAELADRFRDEKVTLGGQVASPAELLRRFLEEEESTSNAAEPKPAPQSAESSPDLANPVDPAWQLRFAESIEAGMTAIELNQWESHTLSATVPAVTLDGATLFANYLG